MTSTSVSRGDKDVPKTHDLGQRAVRRVFEMCLIDEKWTVWEERGFSWWAKDFRQRVWVEPAIHDDGFEIYRLFAATDFVANTKCSQDDLSQKLCLTGMFASLAASVHTPGDEVVNLLSSMYVHEATFEWVIRFFATATIP